MSEINLEVIRDLHPGDVLVVRVPDTLVRSREFLRSLTQSIQQALLDAGLVNKVGVSICAKDFDLERIEAPVAKRLLAGVLRKEGEPHPEYTQGWEDGALATAAQAQVNLEAWDHGNAGGLKWDDIMAELRDLIHPAGPRSRG